MFKTYQFKMHCKGDSHSSKTANIILPGPMILPKLLNIQKQAGKLQTNSLPLPTFVIRGDVPRPLPGARCRVLARSARTVMRQEAQLMLTTGSTPLIAVSRARAISDGTLT